MSARDAPSGLFLVVEGVEGAGKTTQVRHLSRWLDEIGVSHVVAREPGGTPVGEAIRSVVLEREELDVLPVTELLLILAARAAFVEEVVRPTLEAGDTVVADRYELSTLAYQGYGRGLALDEVRRVNRLATGGVRPDLCLVLDVPVETGLGRQRAEGKRPDRMEREGGAFLERVRDGYLEEAASDRRVVLVDGLGTADAVHERVKETLRRRLPETFRGDGA